MSTICFITLQKQQQPYAQCNLVDLIVFIILGGMKVKKPTSMNQYVCYISVFLTSIYSVLHYNMLSQGTYIYTMV